MPFECIVLCAGQGKRIRSRTPKVLLPVAGQPLLAYPVRAALELGASRVVVVTSPKSEALTRAALVGLGLGERVDIRVQEQPRGTGDAVRVGLDGVRSLMTLILCGDTPLLTAPDLEPLLATEDNLSLLSARLDDPRGYGRILRDASGSLVGIREQRDAAPKELAITEVNAGVYFGPTRELGQALSTLSPNNAQSELYLTDIVPWFARHRAARAVLGSSDALMGVNDREDLERVEQLMLERIRSRHRCAGVTIQGRPRIDDAVCIGEDSTISDGVVVTGKSQIGAGVRVETGCVLQDAHISDRAWLKPYSVIVDSQVGEDAQIGPFAHLRPGSEIEAEAHIGNFVETKKTRVRRGAKANHLAYLGDGDIGEKANVGAGTIFCNYDGYRKHKTVIKEGAFIGSDSQLVAPVTIGAFAYVATGTTVTRDVPDNALAIARVRQENKDGYAARLRGRLAAAAGKKV